MQLSFTIVLLRKSCIRCFLRNWRTIVMDNCIKVIYLFIYFPFLHQSSQDNTISDLSLQIPTVENDYRNLVISMRLSLEVDERQYATKQLHIASTNFGNKYFAFVLQKGSPLKKPFDLLYVKLINSINSVN